LKELFQLLRGKLSRQSIPGLREASSLERSKLSKYEGFFF
jgi:hypothetical protein